MKEKEINKNEVFDENINEIISDVETYIDGVREDGTLSVEKNIANLSNRVGDILFKKGFSSDFIENIIPSINEYDSIEGLQRLESSLDKKKEIFSNSINISKNQMQGEIIVSNNDQLNNDLVKFSNFTRDLYDEENIKENDNVNNIFYDYFVHTPKMEESIKQKLLNSGVDENSEVFYEIHQTLSEEFHGILESYNQIDKDICDKIDNIMSDKLQILYDNFVRQNDLQKETKVAKENNVDFFNELKSSTNSFEDIAKSDIENPGKNEKIKNNRKEDLSLPNNIIE